MRVFIGLNSAPRGLEKDFGRCANTSRPRGQPANPETNNPSSPVSKENSPKKHSWCKILLRSRASARKISRIRDSQGCLSRISCRPALTGKASDVEKRISSGTSARLRSVSNPAYPAAWATLLWAAAGRGDQNGCFSDFVIWFKSNCDRLYKGCVLLLACPLKKRILVVGG